MVRRSSVRLGLTTLALTVCSGFGAATAVAADAAAGKTAYAVCAACHGASGEGNLAMNAPRLAAQEPWYVRRQLENFRNGARGTAPGDTHGAQMRPMAMAVADPAAVENLIAYIGTFPDKPSETTVQGDAAAGKAAYAVCAACHGPDAKGNEQLGGPRLSGQDDWYMVSQLHGFQKGLRAYDPKDTFGATMKPMAATLTSEKAINDVVAYINTLR